MAERRTKPRIRVMLKGGFGKYVYYSDTYTLQYGYLLQVEPVNTYMTEA